MNKTIEELVNEIEQKDPRFVEEFVNVTSAEEIVSLMKKHDVELDAEAAAAAFEAAQSQSEELSEGDLDEVAGGFICTATTIAACAIGGAAAGIALGVCVVRLYKLLKYGC